MSLVQETFNAIGRKMFESEKPAAEAFKAKYAARKKNRQVVNEFVTHRNGEWIVLNHTKDKVIGRHATRAEAMEQFEAAALSYLTT